MSNALGTFLGAALKKRQEDLEAALTNERVPYKAMETLGEAIGKCISRH
jgi:hypothetical protein